MANFTRNAKRQKAEDTTFHDTEDLPEGGGGGGFEGLRSHHFQKQHYFIIRKRLSKRSVRAFATMPKGSMGQ